MLNGLVEDINAMVARLNDVNALLSALEIGTLQQAPDGEWYACYWDEDQQRTQCERSAPPTALQAQMLAMSASERARLQQALTAEAADLVRQIDEATRQVYYGASDPATTVVRVTSQQTPTGPIQVVTQTPAEGPMPSAAASSLLIPEGIDFLPVDGGGLPFPGEIPPEGYPTPPTGFIPEAPAEEAEGVAAAATAGAGVGIGAGAGLILGGLAALLFIGRGQRRKR